MAKPIEPVKATVLLMFRDATHVQLVLEYTDKDGQIQSAETSIPYTRWDEQTRTRVPDVEAMKAAEERVKELFDVTMDNLPDAVGKEVDLYIRDGKAFLYPVKPFFQFTTVKGSDAQALRKLAKTGQEFELLPLTEYKGQRFNFAISADIGGERRNFRISQFEIDKDNGDTELVSTKYCTKSIQSYIEQLADGAVSKQEHRERLEKTIEQMLETSREYRIKQLNELLGIDIEQMLQNDDTFKVTIVVKAIGSGETSFLVASKVD